MTFLLGVIIGLLIRDIKYEILKKVDIYKNNQENKGHAEFYESIDFKEKFKSAVSVDDLLK